MSADEDKATFVRLIELINNKDLSYVDEVFAPEYVLHAPDGTVDREGYKKSMQAMLTAFPDWHCRVDQIIADGHAIAARITVTGTNTGPLVLPQGTYPPTGRWCFAALGRGIWMIANYATTPLRIDAPKPQPVVVGCFSGHKIAE